MTVTAKPLSVLSLLRQAARFSVTNVVAVAIGIPAWLFVAQELGPTDLGRAQFVILAFAYASLIRLGTFEAGQRELVHEASRGSAGRALRAQNVGMTVDLIVSVVSGLVLASAAAFFDDPVRRVGFALAPIAVVGASWSGYFTNLHLAHGRYPLAAKANLMRQVGGQLLTVFAVVALGPYGVVISPMIADWSVVAFYRRSGPSLGLAVTFGWTEAWRLLRIGFPLGAMAVVYWAYSLAGNTAAALWTDVTAFGVYTFAAAPLLLVRRALAGVSTVLTPTLWGELGRHGTASVAPSARRLIEHLAILGGATTNLVQAGFGPAVLLVAPRFRSSIPVFEALAFDVLVYLIPVVPSLVLDSVAVGRQWRHLSLWTVALGINTALNFGATHLGLGIQAIAWNDVLVQSLVAIALLWTARRELAMRPGSAFPIIGASAWTVVVWSVLLSVPQPRETEGVPALLLMLFVRVAVVLTLWLSAIAITTAGGRLLSRWRPA